MKTLRSRLTLALSAFALPVLVQGGIVGSAHDFSDQAWNPTTQICVVCHAPHWGWKWEQGLLWNHELSTAVYEMYDSTWSSTIDGEVRQPNDPTYIGVTKLCLGCHDGTVAVNQFLPEPSGTLPAPQGIAPTVVDGTNLRVTHPVSISYEYTVDPELRDPAETVPAGTAVPLTVGDLLFADETGIDRVECASCHDVHNGPEAEANKALLRVSLDNSAICFACHVK
jgi:predicted CXXCH cytochrome family protein